MAGSSAVPKYWDLLSTDDQHQYTALQEMVSAPVRKNRRNRSLQTFGEIIDAIKAFVMRNDSEDWKRALVCGICWLGADGPIGINTRQLRLLVSKCKSSINGSFQLLGFGNVSAGTDCSVSISKIFPVLKDSFTELRQWTLRQAAVNQADKFISPAPDVAACDSIDFGVGLVTQFADFVRSPTEQLVEKEPFILDAISFMPNEAELKDWDDGLAFETKTQVDFGFEGLK
jgi:hypothetical protein